MGLDFASERFEEDCNGIGAASQFARDLIGITGHQNKGQGASGLHRFTLPANRLSRYEHDAHTRYEIRPWSDCV